MAAPRHTVLDPSAGKQVAPGLCALGVMTKAPQPGKVKTRLTPPLFPEEAAALNERFLRDTASAIAQASRQAPATGVGVYTPVGAERAYDKILPDDFYLIPQREGDFGNRLADATADILGVGFDAVCLIDSDSPTVPVAAYVEAVATLQQTGKRLVLGPSDDGGYYLIGMTRLHRELYEEIDWSTERVAKQTITQAKRCGLSVHLLPTWYDVDERETLARLCRELLSRDKSATQGFAAPATREYLAALVQKDAARVWADR
jgi:rSAM/selenodomain-associated transferase 1